MRVGAFWRNSTKTRVASFKGLKAPALSAFLGSGPFRKPGEKDGTWKTDVPGLKARRGWAWFRGLKAPAPSALLESDRFRKPGERGWGREGFSAYQESIVRGWRKESAKKWNEQTPENMATRRPARQWGPCAPPSMPGTRRRAENRQKRWPRPGPTIAW